MKKIWLLLNLLFMIFNFAFSQNVGIGTITPVFKLDVKEGSINTDSLYRIGGNPVLSVKGTANTFVGMNSGFLNTTGYFNTAHGHYSFYSNDDGVYNTANGAYSLFSNTTGDYNTAGGAYSLYSNTYGGLNTAYGNGSLQYNITGSQNTALGYYAMRKNVTGYYNTAIGSEALMENTSGGFNTAVGNFALNVNTAGTSNVAIGYGALSTTTGSEGNTAIGASAGDNYNNGYYNTFLGSGADANGAGYYNSIAIGNSSTITAPVQVRIGGSFITSIGGYQNWTNLSDGRFKKNIKEDVKGLEFIMKLRPVTYNMDISGISQKLNESHGREADKLMLRSIAEKEMIVYSGFVAQEVEKVSKETGYNFSGVDKPKNENDFYGLRYAEFVVPLVKGMQEQQQQFNEMKKEIDQLKEQNKILKQLLNKTN